MEVLSKNDVLGPNLVDDSTGARSVERQEVNTLDTIRDIEKGLEANLQQYMDFLQVLTKDRPKTAPHLELAQRVLQDFDASTVASDTSREEANKLCFQTVVSEVDLEWDESSTIPAREKKRTWIKSVPTKKHAHHNYKTESRFVLQGLNSRIKTWSTEPINESYTPKSIVSSISSQKDKVIVCVRMRPFNEHEKVCPLKQVLCSQKDKVIVKDYNYLRQGNTKTKMEVLQFDVDYVMDDSFLPRSNRQRKEESQRRMFETLGKPCIENALDGINTTIMAYGQMGSGKTYTMMGDGTLSGTGLVPRIVHELMHRVHKDQKNGAQFSIQVCYLEIYQEKVRDLLVEKNLEHINEGFRMNCNFKPQAKFLSKDRKGSSFSFQGCAKKDYLRVWEHPITSPYVEGLIWKDVTTCGEMDKLVKQGASNRTLGSTNIHKLSSRGHTLFTIKLIKMTINGNSKSTNVSHISLVDLTGSEKMATSQRPTMERTYESKYINRSFSQLNDEFTNLSSGRINGKFVSYRSSSLTWLLQESLCGSSKTFLVANISPAEQDFQESIHTLRCAAKAKRIHGPPNQKLNIKNQILMKMNDEIRTLQYLIAELTRKNTYVHIPTETVKNKTFDSSKLIPLPKDHMTNGLLENIRPTSQKKELNHGNKSPNHAKEKLYANKRILVTLKDNLL